MPRSTPPLPGCRSTPPLPGSSASFKADVVIERRQEETEEGKCEIESDDHVIVCVEAASASSEDTEAVDEGTEAEEAEEAEEEGGDRDTCSPPSPCHVLDGHFDALTALANEGRNTGTAIAFSPLQSLVAQLFKMPMVFSFCLVVKLFHLKRNTRHQLIHATFLSIKSL